MTGFAWCPRRGSGSGQTRSSRTISVGWEMNVPVWLCQNHILKCCKPISHGALQHLWAAWTTRLFKILSPSLWASVTKPNKQPDAERFPHFTPERKSSKSPQCLTPTLLLSSGAFLLTASFPRKVWTAMEELFINLESRSPTTTTPSPPLQPAKFSDIPVSILRHVAWRLWINSAAPRERRTVVKRANVSRDVFSWWNKATGKARERHSGFWLLFQIFILEYDHYRFHSSFSFCSLLQGIALGWHRTLLP